MKAALKLLGKASSRKLFWRKVSSKFVIPFKNVTWRTFALSNGPLIGNSLSKASKQEVNSKSAPKECGRV
ncbi:protein of unknown function [Thermococcus camini]|uniref:Uncharacterized protein n=1 Tax=Thermococcus camini TaxID=2016373 RepID=A0A7G2D6Q9_9EURY|nr:protein of unknown function [Thermococcus camini]